MSGEPQEPKFVIWWAVQGGSRPGVYKSWKECSAATLGQSTRYFRFTDYDSAHHFAFGNQTQQQSFVPTIHYPSEASSSSAAAKRSYDSEVPQEIVIKRSRLDNNNNNVARNNLPTPQPGVNMANRLLIYTDGCCYNNGKANSKGGIGIYWGPNDKRNVASPLRDGVTPTNNRAEMTACIVALSHPDCKTKPVELFTDSTYVIDCIKWVKGWKSRGWVTASGTEVKNKDLIIQLWGLVENRSDIILTHVSGHTGVEGNEAADALSKRGAQMS